MWERSFIATSVALGASVDDALEAIGGEAAAGASVHALLAGLRAPDRPARAGTLAGAIRDIVIAIDGATLR